MNSEVTYTASDSCSFEELLLFLQQVESDFSPPLFQRVDADTFVSKVLEKAIINTCRLNDKLIGAIIFYANNLHLREAYITFLAVDHLYRGHHIASNLLQLTYVEAKSKGMTKIHVSTCNPTVVQFYQNHGFLEFKKEFDSDATSMRFYLVRDV